MVKITLAAYGVRGQKAAGQKGKKERERERKREKRKRKSGICLFLVCASGGNPPTQATVGGFLNTNIIIVLCQSLHRIGNTQGEPTPRPACV